MVADYGDVRVFRGRGLYDFGVKVGIGSVQGVVTTYLRECGGVEVSPVP